MVDQFIAPHPSGAPAYEDSGFQSVQAQAPDVSIVLPVHNGETFLEAALDSILAQTHRDFELIAVDDCSRDASPQILAAHAARDARVRVITLSENAKLPGALNAGFAHAQADWLTWTSDDNVLGSTMLERLLAKRDEYPQADILYADYRVIDHTGETTRYVEAAPADLLLERNVVGCCFLYRRAVHDALGGYDEASFGVEDYDFWLRAARAGFTLQPVHEELYAYRRHDRSLTDRRWFEIREASDRMLGREIALAPHRPARAAAWLSLFTADPYRPKPRFLFKALAEHPPAVLARWRELGAWARRAIAWRLK